MSSELGLLRQENAKLMVENALLLAKEAGLWPELWKGLKQIFHPPENHSSYHVVCGEHGAGKTTLTRLTARKFGQGVIYVDVPANLDEFGDEFDSLYYRGIKASQVESGYLQDDAKDKPISVNTSQYLPVRSLEEWNVSIVFGRLEGNKRERINGISNQQAEDKTCRGKKKYDLVGGRIRSRLINFWLDNPLKQSTLAEVKKKFDFAKLLRNQSRHETGKRVIHALLDSEEIDTDVFRMIRNTVKF
ncbi:5112_t:CDS:2 [Paraglomus occultum]|uniref:5112_t:CDS:1 n=1 Tax=Paraglomus occultum TaxID=144539 RepID=A0A9N9FJV0_9GLOM|nr:5112_t:CDS:2 [Paraglomus occultum]